MFQTILKASSEAIRLFCIPHAGAGPSAFRGWVSDLAPEIEAVLVELPGREGRFSDPAYVDMELLVRDFTDAVLPYVDDVQEFAFFGNSMGGLVSFEVLQAIKAQTGQEATHLFVSATGAPQLPCPLPPVASLSDCKLIQEICRRYDGIPAEILADQEFLAAVLGTIRADMQESVTERFRLVKWSSGRTRPARHSAWCCWTRTIFICRVPGSNWSRRFAILC